MEMLKCAVKLANALEDIDIYSEELELWIDRFLKNLELGEIFGFSYEINGKMDGSYGDVMKGEFNALYRFQLTKDDTLVINVSYNMNKRS